MKSGRTFPNGKKKMHAYNFTYAVSLFSPWLPTICELQWLFPIVLYWQNQAVEIVTKGLKYYKLWV